MNSVNSVGPIEIIRWPSHLPDVTKASVSFAVRQPIEKQWALTVAIDARTSIIKWVAEDVGGAHMEGRGMVWANGRLTASGSGADYIARLKFREFIERVGLSLGWIEVELRDMTGYREERP